MALSVPVVVALSVPVCRQETQGKISPSSLADAQDNHGLYLACLLVNNKLSTDRGKGNRERYQIIKINIRSTIINWLMTDSLLAGRFELTNVHNVATAYAKTKTCAKNLKAPS